ncbi:hypothetical protein CRUP_007043 [Coryphaenoides rupestris]|nr:hypothetical protein CRUP_007043 [Coryphaenoides rupestris]
MAWRGCVFTSLTGQQLTRFKHGLQQQRAFRRPAKKTEVRRGGEEEVGPSHSPASQPWSPSPLTPRRDLRRLLKPLVFTVGYEALKSRVQSYFDELRADWLEKLRPQKQGDFRKEVNQWWNSLSKGQRVVTGIIAANLLVYCCWKVPSLQRTMLRYFTSDPSASKAVCSSMLLSTFSHQHLLHLSANMWALWSFSSSAVSMLGPEQFLAVYLSAGVISTMASYVAKTITGRFGPSLGASGAIMTILAAVCIKMPEAKLAIVFLPMFTFTAGNALAAIVAMDTAGVVLGWRVLDHAAHLGGSLWYILYGHELIWKNRDSLVQMWHNLRTGGPGGGGGGGAGAV